ncbi:DUF3418 domain-containing protein [Desulfosarcina cetonica]|uniref:DUF3418 domain-containing protein n=1 Tax=Desulfosarcina cetonica TaxID=90730 RepID=UPI00248ACC76|nr:DUF3418 domain-containing protein [Desulfosarcina cetonica]
MIGISATCRGASRERPKGHAVRIYPRLAVEGDTLGIRLFTDARAAETAHREGVATLLTRRFADDVKYLKKNLKLPALLKRQVVYFGGMAALEAQLVERVIRQLFARDPLTSAAFDALVGELMALKVHQSGQDLKEAVVAVIEAHHEARLRILEVEQKRIAAPQVGQFLESLKGEIQRLVPDNFIQLYDRQRLLHLVRYLKTIAVRVERGLGDLAKDHARQDQVAPHLQRLGNMLAVMDGSTSTEKRAAVEDFFWMIEEYKISLFAQEVGTDGPVSAKRLNKLAEEIERMV